jgi:hypothetical protein
MKAKPYIKYEALVKLITDEGVIFSFVTLDEKFDTRVAEIDSFRKMIKSFKDKDGWFNDLDILLYPEDMKEDLKILTDIVERAERMGVALLQEDEKEIYKEHHLALVSPHCEEYGIYSVASESLKRTGE